MPLKANGSLLGPSQKQQDLPPSCRVRPHSFLPKQPSASSSLAATTSPHTQPSSSTLQLKERGTAAAPHADAPPRASPVVLPRVMHRSPPRAQQRLPHQSQQPHRASPSERGSPQRFAALSNGSGGGGGDDADAVTAAAATRRVVRADVPSPTPDAPPSFNAPGVRVGDYMTHVADLKLAVEQSEKAFPDVRLLMPAITVPHTATGALAFEVARPVDADFWPGAIAFEVVSADTTFFTSVPIIDPSGTLTFHATRHTTGRKGTTVLSFRTVDHSEVDPLTHQFSCSRVVTLQIDFAAVPIAKRRLVNELGRALQYRSPSPEAEGEDNTSLTRAGAAVTQLDDGSIDAWQQRGVAAQKGSTSTAVTIGVGSDCDRSPQLAAPGAQEPPFRLERRGGLRPLSIHAFRRDPPHLTASLIAQYYIRANPLAVLKLCTFAAEYDLLTATTATDEECEGLLEAVRCSMDSRAPMDTIIPQIDTVTRLHLRIGGAAELETAEKLALLRIQLISATLGIDVDSDNLNSVVAVRLASAKQHVVQLYVRALVEGAHTLKMLGRFPTAIKFYHLAATVTTIGNKSAAGAKATTSLVPFFVAAGDCHLMLGEHDAALECYERARAFAEVSGAGTVLAECEDLIAVASAMLGRFEDAQQSAQRSLRIRKDFKVPSSIAESLLVQCFVFAASGGREQALSAVIHATDLLVGARSDGLVAKSSAHPRLVAGGGASNQSQELLWASALIMHAWISMPRPGEAAAAVSHLRDAVGIIATACDRRPRCWEVALPLWMLECCQSPGGGGAQHLDRAAELTRDIGESSILGSCVALSALVSLVHEDEFDASGACAVTDAVSTGTIRAKLAACASSLVARLAPQSPLRLTLAEAEALVYARLERFAAAVEPLAAACAAWQELAPARRALDAPLLHRLSALAADVLSNGAHRALFPPSEGGTARDATRTIGEGLWAMVDERAAVLGEFSRHLVPMIIDVAEVAFARRDFSLALDLLGRAIRIVDDRNLLYLLGNLFRPAMMLTPHDCAERSRLVAERCGLAPCAWERGAAAAAAGEEEKEEEKVSGHSSIDLLAALMWQVGVVHEAAGDLPQATAAYHQSVAALEMVRLDTQSLVALEALTGIARTLLHSGEHGDALVFVEAATELFQAHHYRFGQFRSHRATVEVHANIERTRRAISTSGAARGGGGDEGGGGRGAAAAPAAVVRHTDARPQVGVPILL